ncbi:MAG: PilC/PilY family type IV pilus protein [Gammaproteobacteria bacterium]
MKTLIRTILVLSLGLLPSLVYAEDIEIYMAPQQPAGGEPLVMFSLDFRPSLGASVDNYTDYFLGELGEDDADVLAIGNDWSYFDLLRQSIRVVMQDLSGLKIGLMLNHNNQNNCAGPANVKNGCSTGGYIAMGFQSLELGDTNGAKAHMASILRAMPTPQGGLSHFHQGKELFFEFFRYLTGGDVYSGRNGYRDYAGASGSSNSINLDVNFPDISWDTSVMEYDRRVSNYDVYKYISPLSSATHCTKIFTINFQMNVVNSDSDADNAIAASKASGGLGSSMGNFADIVGYLYDADLGNDTYGVVPDINGIQNVVSYFVAPSNLVNHAHIKAQASEGGTGLPLPAGENPEDLIETLRNIFQQILSVSTTFVAASVPVNVFNRSEIVDNVYIALFQADADGRPRWPGSLKKLKIEQDAQTVRLVDALDANAVAPDGRLNYGALTFWTDSASLPPADVDNEEVEGRDGRAVDRGGAGQKIPGFISGSPGETNATAGARTLYTEPSTITDGTLMSLLALDATAANATLLQSAIGAANATEALAMLKWMRGLDIDDLDNDTETDDARPWILGDPLHSRPLPINYGARGDHTLANPDIRIMMGSNDGYLRMFRNTDTNGNELGTEVWGFMPRSVMNKMPILRTDEPLGGLSPHPYAVDGAPVVYTRDVNGNGTIDAGDRVIVYIGLRRGGNAYYALDITDPDVPYLLWRITSDDSGFESLGLTFSTPQIGTLRLDIDGTLTPTPVLIFAGGYDTNKDARGGGGTDDNEGNSIYVVNALTGALIWNAAHDEMVDSIPSDVTAVDTSGDGYTDRIYVGDTGGTVWRVDTVGDPDSDWLVYPLARLGRHFDDDSPANERRFFHAPDVVLARDSESSFDAVVIGSGDRANPLDRGYTGVIPENYLYMIKDRRTVSGPLLEDEVLPTYDPDNLGDVTSNCIQAGDCPDGGTPDLTHGWRLRLEETGGEKSLALPFTIGGTIFFTTYLPPGEAEAATCGPSEGGGVLYAVALADARSTINFDSTDDDPDNPGEATSRSDRTRALRSGGIPAEVVSLPPNRILLPDLSTEAIPGSMRWRTYWYEGEQTP